MAGDSALRRYDLRPRAAISYSLAIARSTRQQKRSRRSRRALLNPTAPTPPSLTPPSLPTLQLARVPYLPPEIVCMILSYYSTHDEAITILPTRKLVEEEAAFNERMSRIPPTVLRDALARGMVPLKPSITKMLIAPPHQSHKKSEIGLLLTSKLFHDEFIKQFYSENIFTFLGGGHDMVWLKMSETKRAHVRHIQLESLWELDLDFFGAGNSTQPHKASFSIKPVWGRSEIHGLMDFGAGTVMFPNLQSITQKVRLRRNKDWKGPSPNVLNIVLNLDVTNVVLRQGKVYDLMVHKGARERAKKLVVTAIQARWKHLTTESYLAKTEIGFMYSQTLEWDKEAVMRPFLSLV